MEKKSCVLVTGATGLLGREVLAKFLESGWNAIGTGWSRASESVLKLDLSDEAAVQEAVQKLKPNVIVHCAANKYPDQVAKDPDQTRKLNVLATDVIAQAAAKVGPETVLIYISTDYVFPGLPGEAPYEIDAATSAPNLYGQTKLDGETAVMSAACACVVLRVPVLYGKAEKAAESAVNVLMDAVWDSQKVGHDVQMDNWAKRYPTNTQDVARVIYDVANRYLESPKKSHLPKILQFSAEEEFTKYEICKIFADLLGLSVESIKAESEPPAGQTPRPYNTHLSTKSLQDIGIDVSAQDFASWWKWQLGAFKK